MYVLADKQVLPSSLDRSVAREHRLPAPLFSIDNERMGVLYQLLACLKPQALTGVQLQLVQPMSTLLHPCCAPVGSGLPRSSAGNVKMIMLLLLCRVPCCSGLCELSPHQTVSSRLLLDELSLSGTVLVA
jgi:hypothetical protein